MTVFAVVAIDHPNDLDRRVVQDFQGSCHQLGNGHWLVSSFLSAQEVSTKVGWGQTYEGRSGMVYGISGYFGVASSETWPWIAANWNRQDA